MRINTYTYMMTARERRYLIILYICINSERVTLEKLIDLTETSRNTVLNDLNSIRDDLQNSQYKVSLQTTKQKGYFLRGATLGRVQYMHKIYSHIFSNGSLGFLEIVQKTISETDSNAKYGNLKKLFENQVPVLEKNLGKKINKHELKLMIKTFPLVLMSCWNMQLNHSEVEEVCKDLSVIHARIEYKAALKLAEIILEELSLRLNAFETVTIALLLLSYRKDSDEHATSKDWHYLKKTIDACIAYFEEVSVCRLEQKEELSKALLSHAKAMLFRKKYGILSINPLTEQIKEKYPEVFCFTKNSVELLEESWKIDLTDDDIAYIAVHFGGALKNTYSRYQKSSVYVVCDEGLAVQKLLIKQLCQYIPEEDIKAVFTTEQFKSIEEIIDLGLLISTSRLETELPFIFVHPILTEDDSAKIGNSSCFQLGKFSEFKENLEGILSNYIREHSAVKECSRSILEMTSKILS
ncbi:BglG family transcription antiterminator [Lactococcus ileimucosae]|uniref:BglG family transcription antiterminator n=1 Tax=Lactococcus ileimucosae TaxID=2941329 RepID=UPI0020449FF4|nr:PRD domain-containing protein [Lactococcus ileimucosae]